MQNQVQPTSPYDIYADAVEAAAVKRKGMLGATNTSIAGRVDAIKDAVSLAIPLLVGAVTFLAVAPARIKTPWLFYLSCGVLVLSIVLAMVSRSRLILYLQNVAFAAESWFKEVVDASRLAKYDPTDSVKADRLIKAETSPINMPNISRFDETSYRIVTYLFLVGLLGLTLGLLAKISF